jgi:hypothetical protein
MPTPGSVLLDNADTSICSERSNSSGIVSLNTNMTLTNCEFTDIDTGAVVISGGSLVVNNSTFNNNYVTRPTGFPNLRHNIFASNGAVVNITSMTVDSGQSFFVYASDDYSNVRINGLDTPLFVPTIASAQPSALSPGESTTFAFSGGSLYPCGLYLNVSRDADGNSLVGSFIANVHDESTATFTIRNDVFEGTDSYYAFFVYGPDYAYRTKAIQLFVDGQLSRENNVVGLVVGIVIAIIAVVAVLLVVVVFLGWRYRLRQRWSTESKNEQMGMSGEETRQVGSMVFL